MSYDDLEQSNYDAIPITLYEFKLGSAAWRYCSGDESVILDGNLYTAIAIEDGGITQSGDAGADDFVITIDESAPFNDLFLGSPPSEAIFVTMRRQNFGDTEAPVQWAGTLKSNHRKSLATREITCRTLTNSLDRLGLRLSWGRGCPHALYDRNCRVDPSAYGVTTTVTEVAGNTLTLSGLSSYANGYFAGGYIEFVYTSGAIERIAIESHTSGYVETLGSADRISVSQMVTLYPGCDRITSTCEGKFNNLSNYGGFPHLPTKSPFDGDPVF